MKTSQNTVLIIGGTAGIGLSIASKLSALGNKVIITGRNQDRLNKAAEGLSDVVTIPFDVSKPEEIDQLVTKVKADYPELNLVINNAGRAVVHSLADENTDTAAIAEDEMLTNYLSIIRLNQKLLPVLKQQSEAAIVNVSSIVVYVPGILLPTYAASKAALHSYSTSLRLALADGNIKVFELMPPLVDTEFSKEIGGHRGIKPDVVAEEFIKGLAADEFEIRVGDTAAIYELFLKSPAEALKVMNSQRAETAE